MTILFVNPNTRCIFAIQIKYMKASELKSGIKIRFTPTGKVFELKTVTEKRIFWYTGFAHKSSYGKNTMKTAGTSINKFQQGIDDGTYEIIPS